MNVQSYSETRANFKASMDAVAQNHQPLLVTSKSSEVVMMAKEDYDSLQETLYLLSSRANADRLLSSIAEHEAGKVVVAEEDENGEYQEKA